MGGGGSNSSPPVDVAPGGGTYPVNAFGEAYNPAWGPTATTGGTLGLIGQGLQSAGKGIASGETPVGSPQTPQISSGDIYGSPQQPYQPIAQNNLMDILYRLLGG